MRVNIMGDSKYRKLYYIVLLLFGFGAIARGVIGLMGIELSENVTAFIGVAALAGVALYAFLVSRKDNNA